MIYKESGFSLLELLISSSLSILLSTGLVLSLKEQIAQIRNFQDKTEELYSIERVAVISETLIDELDQHRVNIIPRIHKDGKIKFPDDSYNQIMHAANPPSLFSDAISSIQLRTFGSLRINQINSHYSIILNACHIFPTLEINQEKSYLGVTQSGFVELIVINSTFSNGCYQIEAFADKSMIFKSELSQILNLEYILPIQREYTLFVDSLNQFRYLGHRGSVNIENQPITSRIKNIKLLLSPILEPFFYNLQISIFSSSNQSTDRNFQHRLSRLSNSTLIEFLNEAN